MSCFIKEAPGDLKLRVIGNRDVCPSPGPASHSGWGMTTGPRSEQAESGDSGRPRGADQQQGGPQTVLIYGFCSWDGGTVSEGWRPHYSWSASLTRVPWTALLLLVGRQAVTLCSPFVRKATWNFWDVRL